MADTASCLHEVKKHSLLYIVIVSALGGFLFGFDSGVISGCEEAIQREFQLSGFWHGFTVSGALIGTIIGAFSVGWPSDKFGRRPTLMLMAVLFIVSGIGCAFSGTQPVLAWMRFIGGLAIGGASVVVPLYIVEVSPGPVKDRHGKILPSSRASNAFIFRLFKRIFHFLSFFYFRMRSLQTLCSFLSFHLFLCFESQLHQK